MKKKSTVFDLHVPLWLIDEAMAACKKAAELEDGMEWRQCEVPGCSRWYHVKGGAGSSTLEVIALGAESCGIHSIGLFERRWACKICSGRPDGRFLSKNEHLVPPAATNGEETLLPCDWCSNQGLSACDPDDHDKGTWDGETHGLGDDTDIVAQGVKLPPGWVSGVRTKSTTGQSYKIFDFFCSGCGKTVHLDRVDKFLIHLNQRTSKNPLSPRRCIVRDMDPYLVPLIMNETSEVREEGRGGEGASDPVASDHPFSSVAASPNLLCVFKGQSMGDLGRMATQIHIKLAGILAECRLGDSGDAGVSPGGQGGGEEEDWTLTLSPEAREVLSSVRYQTHARRIIAGARELYEETRVGRDGMFKLAKRSRARDEGARYGPSPTAAGMEGLDPDCDVFIVEGGDEEGDEGWVEDGMGDDLSREDEEMEEDEGGGIFRKRIQRRKMNHQRPAVTQKSPLALVAAAALGSMREKNESTLDQCWSPGGAKPPLPLPHPSSDDATLLREERRKRQAAEAELRTANEALRLLGQQIDQAHDWILQVNGAPGKSLAQAEEALRLFQDHMVQLKSWSLQINQTARQV